MSSPPLAVSNGTQIPRLNSSLLAGRAPGSLEPRVFTTSGSFTVPAGVTHVLIDAVGGGGGGSSPDAGQTNPGSGGGQGGEATFLSSVTPGQRYSVIVGQGGATSATAGAESQPGGNSYVAPLGQSQATAIANGGGGQGADTVVPCGGGSDFGNGGFASHVNPATTVVTSKLDGRAGSTGVCAVGGGGTGGGENPAAAGRGGDGGWTNDSTAADQAQPGQPGLVIVEFLS